MSVDTCCSTSDSKNHSATKNIDDVLMYLKDKSRVDCHGMRGSEVFVEKEMLRLAAVYLEDLLLMAGVL